jgi:RimJ/RimL family protein N-acetyltransferase
MNLSKRHRARWIGYARAMAPAAVEPRPLRSPRAPPLDSQIGHFAEGARFGDILLSVARRKPMDPEIAMVEHANHLGQPIGVPVDGWAARERPARTPMSGRFCRVEPLDAARHAAELYAANSKDRDGRMWTYLPWGPYAAFDDYLAAIEAGLRRADFITYAVIDAVSGKAVGVASYLNINPTAGSIEVGGIAYSPALQRKPAGTEAMYLMMRRVFDELGYRRYEWKCNALNAPSRAAAERYGFRFEGVFRQADIIKGRNRDTAWFSIVDSEWARIKAAFERWLDPGNFDDDGRQRVSLSALAAR